MDRRITKVKAKELVAKAAKAVVKNQKDKLVDAILYEAGCINEETNARVGDSYLRKAATRFVNNIIRFTMLLAD